MTSEHGVENTRNGRIIMPFPGPSCVHIVCYARKAPVEFQPHCRDCWSLLCLRALALGSGKPRRSITRTRRTLIPSRGLFSSNSFEIPSPQSIVILRFAIHNAQFEHVSVVKVRGRAQYNCCLTSSLFYFIALHAMLTTDNTKRASKRVE